MMILRRGLTRKFDPIPNFLSYFLWAFFLSLLFGQLRSPTLLKSSVAFTLENPEVYARFMPSRNEELRLKPVKLGANQQDEQAYKGDRA
ncbi:hypothetical protein SLEP1_g53268 [Rubroshorea leprosula]|uniref:Uncharacterized protein n=1 Tax=Rubroshorea leprosula TaxID=152421 RepID=A0AAV5M9S6_9ROSI|nr:hypothetical protein SLEP1_g53268 [Rubroshorea leprosula]